MGRSVRAIGTAGALLLACGCAGGGVASVKPAGGPPWKAFEGARTVALVHDPARGRSGGPVHDVVDGLGDSLAARGWEVRPPLPEAAKELEALRDRLEGWGGPALDAHTAVSTGVAEKAGEVVRAAGVDAAAFGWRFGMRAMPRDPLFGRSVGAGLDTQGSALGAIVLVGARGDVVRVEWGGSAGGAGASGTGEGAMPESPAEAIEVLLDAIAPRGDDGVSPAKPPARAP
jgi:hypothetical protein